ncbi:MAG: glycosyltransferase [Pseudomonadota bacterium]
MISVIVPFKNAAHFLPSLIRALTIQELPRDQFEVVFVDNQSDDGSSALITSAAPSFVYRLASYTARKSSYGARNAGVRLASGTILAFTDADCIPEPQWLAEIARFYERAESRDAVLSGDVRFFFADPTSPWEHFDRNVHMQNAARAVSNQIATANMAVLLANFHRIGDFEEVLSGADFAWSARAAQESLRVAFVAEARVLHPTRGSFIEMRRKLDRIAYGQGELCRQAQRGLTLELLRYLIRMVLPKSSLLPALSVGTELGAAAGMVLFVGLLRIRFSQLLSFWSGYAGR